MKIINITNKRQLNDFIAGEEHAQFLQSWQWGEFQAETTGKVIRLGVMDNEKLAAAATLVKKKLFMGKSYFYCARGPIFNFQFSIFNFQLNKNAENQKCEEILTFLFSEIKKIAKQERVMFLRFEPLFKSQNSKFKIIRSVNVQPSETLVLDLTKSEDELLAAMRQKTRYNIRLAEKKGVKIIEAGAERFDEFWRLLAATGNRDKFNTHGRAYYQAMLRMDSSFIKLFLAEHQGRMLAGSLTVFFGDTATYIHGGSSDENRELMAPYVLQWQIIKLAKQAGYKYYDFYGIDETKWPGVTRFKLGFGGEKAEYPGTFDLVFDPLWYGVYKMARKARRRF